MWFQVYARRFHNQAVCTCGWHGKVRWFRGSAVGEAYLHGAQYRHYPAGSPMPADHQEAMFVRTDS